MSITTIPNKPGSSIQVSSLRAIYSIKALQMLFCIGISGLTPALASTDQQPAAIQAETAARQLTDNSAAASVLNASMTAATVRKIDTAQAKITLKHAAISNIGMPAMTMVFKVADPKLLISLQVNDEVKFSVEKQGSSFVVTAIEKQMPTKIE